MAATVTESQYGFSDVLKPYAETLLGQAAGLTDPASNPYLQYQGERYAQFTPLQQQSFTNVGSMAPAAQIEQATGLAKLAAQRGLDAKYGPSQYQSQSFTQPGAAEKYMSPYMQQVVDINKREAQRQADIAGTQRGAKAAGAGAFGGARQAIENAEAQRNLAMQMGDIQNKGMQDAYGQGMSQFNAEQQAAQQAAQLREQSSQYGAGLGMQGAQLGLGAAGQLGQLGGQYTGQMLDINKLQNQYGGQQQQQVQNILGAQYQDFLNAQKHPYQQLGFMSDMIRGLPLTQQTQSMFQPAPSMTNQAVGLGTAALGLSKMGAFAAGGHVGAGLADLAIANMA